MPRIAATLEERLLQPAGDVRFGPGELDGLPSHVRTYFVSSIAHGTPLATSARLRMRGRIKVGGWLPFRAEQLLAPHRGFVWAARAAGVVSGFDRYVDGAGEMDWKLAGLATVAHGDGPDVTASAAGRGGAEAVWLPTALLPRFGVAWTAYDERHIAARYAVGDTPVDLHLGLDGTGRVTSFAFDRWGDPDGTGAFGWHPFGGEATGWHSFDGVTIPSSGLVGWGFGTDRWPGDAFFRYTITDLALT